MGFAVVLVGVARAGTFAARSRAGHLGDGDVVFGGERRQVGLDYGPLAVAGGEVVVRASDLIGDVAGNAGLQLSVVGVALQADATPVKVGGMRFEDCAQLLQPV